jgi:YVTN family beta-propeller protein
MQGFARYTIFCVLFIVPLIADSVRVYQTDSAGDEVHVIDPATNKIVQTIEGIEVPHGVTFSPDGARAWITCEAEKNVWVIDTKSARVIGKVPLSGDPNNLAMSQDGKRVFIGIRAAPGAVDVIDTASLKKIVSIPVKGAVHNVYVTPDGKYAVAGSIEGKMLTVIDESMLKTAWELPFDLGVRPMAFEKAADGSTSRMFVQLSGYHGFAVIDFTTHKEIARIKLPSEPSGSPAEGGAPSHGIGVAPDGKTLWVNSSYANAVFVYSLPDLRPDGYVKTGAVPDWITFAPGKVYIANSGSNSVSVIDMATRREISRIPVGEVPKRNATVIQPD